MPYLRDVLTVVIPCKNERYQIIDTLQVLDVYDEHAGLRVIVADSSTDDTSTLLQKENFYNIDVIVIDGGLPAIARNNGARLVETPYVLFLDADMVITQPLQIYPQYDLVTCTIRTNGAYYIAYYIFHIIQSILKYTTPFAVGGFMLFKKRTFDELGGFNENDKFAEDYHLSSKVSPDKFHISSHKVFTSSRRLNKIGLFGMVKLMIKCWWNRNDPLFYSSDHGYWA